MSHHTHCYCDLCESGYPKMGFTNCTCNLCDPEHLADDCVEHARLCWCDKCTESKNQMKRQQELMKMNQQVSNLSDTLKKSLQLQMGQTKKTEPMHH